MSTRWTAALVAAAFGIATFLLGLTRVGDEPFWMDEAASRYFVDRPLRDLLRVIWRQESGQGPFYLMLWLWQHVTDSDAGLRVVAVAGGSVAVAAAVWFARRWFGWAVAIGTGAMLMMNPFFLRYLTELRGYSWAMAFATIAAGSAVELVLRPRWGWSIVAGLAAGLAIGTVLMTAFWFLVLAVALAAVSWRSVDTARLRLAAVTVLLSVVVAAPLLNATRFRSGQLDWVPATTRRRLVSTMYDVAGGRGWFFVAVVGLAVFTVSVVVLDEARQRVAGVAVLAMAVGGTAALVVVSFVKPLLVTRYFAPSAPFIALGTIGGFVAAGRWAASRLPARFDTLRRPVALAPTVGVLTLMCAAFVQWGVFTDRDRVEDPRAAVEFVEARFDEGDVVVIDRPTPAILRYLGDRPDIDPGWMPPDPARAFWPRRPFADYAAELDEADTVFVFTWNGWNLDPVVERLIARQGAEQTRFGQAIVWVVPSH
ncbi:hypothetical protein BDK89_4320 [Ilumatobacter fluminis]|uniref:Dolichyl-phosphate-mannose-protein mannosyltransferase n=1 Tax=Ilumatobacter fluminis TaxID=467091 RepID=A0A4R7I6L1_9ACTN|nr:hypothetical protein [Ilumatobacter fluminis]TDT18689.1 hypothetical protein BDK89_4320 [Ilumatobacter fluminis]